MYSECARLSWRFGGSAGSDDSKIGPMRPCVPGLEIIGVSRCTPLAR